MSLAVYFTIDGPAVGKGRPRVSTIGGRPRMYTPAKTVAWERRISLAAAGAMGTSKPSDYMWSMRIVVIAAIPSSWPKWRQELARRNGEAPGKPDLDNVAKAVLDACNGIVYIDDKQVCRLTVERRFGAHPRVEVYAHEVLE